MKIKSVKRKCGVNLFTAVKHLTAHKPSGLIVRQDWADGFVGLDDGGFYFSSGMPGNENYVMIDMVFTESDFQKQWRIADLSDIEREKLAADRES